MSDTNTNTNTDTITEVKPAPTRDEIRAKVFGAKPKTAIVEEFVGGCTVELRQPTLGVISRMKQNDQQEQISKMLIDYTYVPGTDVKVFEEADVDALMEVPFGAEMKSYIDNVNILLGIDPVKVEVGIKDATKSA